MNAQTIIDTRSSRSEFTSLELASAYIDRCENPGKWAIVLGDNDKFWVVSNRQAAILIASGFELAY